MSFATRAANGAESAPPRNNGIVAQGRSSSPLDKDWVLVSYKEPSFLDVENVGGQRADCIGLHKGQDASCHANVSGSPEICEAVSALRMRVRDNRSDIPDETASSISDINAQPVKDAAREIALLLEQCSHHRKHYQDCRAATSRSIQRRFGNVFANDQTPSSKIDKEVRRTSMSTSATETQSGPLDDCECDLCEVEQRLKDKVNVLMESRSGRQCLVETSTQPSHGAQCVKVTTDEADASSEASPLLEDYFEKAGDVFVAKERLIKLQEEIEDVLAGSKPYPRLEQPTMPGDANLHEMYEDRRRALVERLADAEKHLMECREACVHQGINPESARYRRISGTVNGRSTTIEDAQSGYGTSLNEP